MLQQCLIHIDAITEWQNQFTNIPHAMAHLWEYNQAMMKSSKLPTYLYSATAPGFKALCPISLREKAGKFDIVTPYGFGGFICAGEYPDFAQHWKQFFTEKGYVCGYISMHPLFNQSNPFQTDELLSANHIYTLDLTQPLDELLKKLSKKHRYELHRWQQSSVKIVMDKARLLTALPDLYRETLVRVNASTVYDFQIETFSSLLTNKNVIALGAVLDEKIEAISLFIYTQHIADYFINASTQAGRCHSRGLIWAGIESLKKLSVPLLNLGGGIKIHDDLDHFKQRFGGTLYNLQALNQIFDEVSFNNLCSQLPIKKNYFPPYHN